MKPIFRAQEIQSLYTWSFLRIIIFLRGMSFWILRWIWWWILVLSWWCWYRCLVSVVINIQVMLTSRFLGHSFWETSVGDFAHGVAFAILVQTIPFFFFMGYWYRNFRNIIENFEPTVGGIAILVRGLRRWCWYASAINMHRGFAGDFVEVSRFLSCWLISRLRGNRNYFEGSGPCNTFANWIQMVISLFRW